MRRGSDRTRRATAHGSSTRATHTARATSTASHHGPPSSTTSTTDKTMSKMVIGDTIARNTVGSMRPRGGRGMTGTLSGAVSAVVSTP